MGIQKAFVALLLCQALAGCAINLHGTQTAANGASTTTLASSVNAGAGAGRANVGASFGSPQPAGASGGQVGFSRGAAVILVLGLAIAETVDFIGSQFSAQQPAELPVAPRASIADTCSCYGWKPQAAAPLE
jgi:hypothetical protein